MPRTPAVLALVGLASISCQERLPPADPDAGPGAAPDAVALGRDGAPTCGPAWQTVPAPIVGVTLLESQPVQVGRAARLRVDLEQCPGDEPGSWWQGATLENDEHLSLSFAVWRAGPACDEPEVVSRDVTVEFAYPGTWSLLPALEIVVEAAPPGACGSAPVDACERDCDCPTGDRCLSGDEGVQRCATPCEFDRECGGDGRCGDGDGLAGICRRDLAECAPPALPCPAGFACADGACLPTFTLNGATRHACDCDADCDAPLRCVEHLVDGSNERRRQCEIICPSPSDGWCQGPHSCNAEAVVDYDDGVCGWVGD